MRSLKFLAGLVLAIFGLFVILGEQLAGTSADAFINAQVTTTSAPIAGMVELVERPLGARVSAGDPLGAINDPLVDNVRLADLIREQANLEAEAQSNEQQYSSLDRQLADLKRQTLAYGRERRRQLQSELAAAKAATEAATTRLKFARLALDRSKSLRTRGIETGASLENAQSLVAVTEREVDAARAQETVAEVNLQAAVQGTFLGDGYNDAPYSQQRFSELRVEQNRLQAEAAAINARKRAVEVRIGAERQRVNRASSTQLVSNVDGILWDYLSATGETVQRGESLVKLVDCNSAIVTLSVSENVYNSVGLGDAAAFRLNGEPRLLEGTVTRLAGSGAATLYDNLAIAASQEHLERFDIVLEVPALRDDPELRCLIGRTGRVFLERRQLDWLRQLWS